jgi:hypothetical protein
MQENSDARPLTPIWAWGLGLLPWVWIVPFNQYFWDDWLTAPLTGWQEQLDRWEGGAKHYLNPVTYFVLLPLGQWVFHLLMLICTVVTAWAVHNICASTRLLGAVAGFAGPITLVIPLFHARFSAANLEYIAASAAVYLAWMIALKKPTVSRRITSTLLMIYAIGVPSLAIVILAQWLHVSWRRASERRAISFLKFQSLYPEPPIVVAVYALIFQFVLNTESRYGPSTGALIEFMKGSIVLLTLIALIYWTTFRLAKQKIRPVTLTALSGALAYLGFFPYFAVGYNPLSDFLPWRIRSEVTTGLTTRISTTLVVLSVIAVCALLFFRRKDNDTPILSSATLLCVPVSFATAVVTLGPMDWESRHWLISWPPLAIFFIALVTMAGDKVQIALARTVFLVFLMASLTISSEYVIDSIKQKSIVSAVASELSAERLKTDDADEILVVVATVESTNRLNARFRTYRPYEWRGLVSQGMSVDPRKLKIMEPSDATSRGPGVCNQKYVATRISPEVNSGRFEALLKFSVRISLNPEPLLLCSDQVRDGYLKDR